MENHKAIFLNNCGVSFLRSGTYASAQHSFTEALLCIMRFQDEDTVADSNVQKSEAEEIAEEHYGLNDKRMIIISEREEDEHNKDCSHVPTSASLLASRLPLHLQGIVVTQEDFSLFEEVEPLSAALGAAVLFNLAVTHHVRGLEEVNHSKSDLRLSCAQNLYVRSQESLSVVVHCKGGISSTKGSSLPLMHYLFLAAPNNYGIIALEMADYENARHAFECVANFALVFDTAECDLDFDRTAQISSSRSVFVLNAMCYGNAMQAAAA